MRMHIREQFETAAGNAIYRYLGRLDQMANTRVVADAMAYAPEEITKGRDFKDIFFDDMMNRFATIMAPVKERHVIPEEYFRWAMIKRYGDQITRQDSHHELTRLMKKARDFDDENPVPEFQNSPVPEFLQILTDSLSSTDLADMTNEWNGIFTQLAKLAASDDALNVYVLNNSVHTASSEAINAAIAAKSQGGKAVALRKPEKPKLGNGFDDDDGDDSTDLDKLGEKLSQISFPETTLESVRKLYKQTRKLNPQASEFSVNCKRLDIISSLPWGQFKEMNSNINQAQQVLDDEHYGLEKVKEQIIQHMAVQNRTGAPDGKIMLLVGPPGVGKTSIAQSVAKATGREYIRIALGGVSKESDIRGHSSTFVGAMPGRIIQEIKKAKSSNPLVVLDEIDKLGEGGAHGDPSAALLELLDPAQNHTFRDDYLGVEFDMSKVLFFCTANDFGNIPGPLRDRMQALHLSSYLQDEKYEIATRYLIPKQMKAKALNESELVIEPEAIKALISHHTMEAGVRGLEKKIGEICSKAVVDIATGKEGQTVVTPENLEQYVGPGHGDRDQIPAQDMVGVVSGLAYSSVGGSVLPIEASLLPSHGFKLTLSGNLGKVMGESAGVAERLVRARAPQFGISDSKLNRTELSVHCPAGATPKDGPSAGAAFTTAIISALTGIPIRRDVAMTGEINSRGEVTAIGGLREKLEGALNAGVKIVLVPKQNIPNLNEVPEKIKSQLSIRPVGTIEEVLEHALTEEINPVVAKPRSRLGQIWDLVVNKPSNDNNQSASIRQPAGPRPDELKIR